MATKSKSKAAELRSEVEGRKVEVRKDIDEIRKSQLGPLEAELIELLALVPDEEPEAKAEEPQEPTPAPVAAASEPKANGKARRKRAGGTRMEQAIRIIKDEPGLSASEVAAKMKIAPNYMYRVLGDAEEDGLVRKDGRQYFPVA